MPASELPAAAGSRRPRIPNSLDTLGSYPGVAEGLVGPGWGLGLAFWLPYGPCSRWGTAPVTAPPGHGVLLAPGPLHWGHPWGAVQPGSRPHSGPSCSPIQVLTWFPLWLGPMNSARCCRNHQTGGEPRSHESCLGLLDRQVQESHRGQEWADNRGHTGLGSTGDSPASLLGSPGTEAQGAREKITVCRA